MLKKNRGRGMCRPSKVQLQQKNMGASLQTEWQLFPIYKPSFNNPWYATNIEEEADILGEYFTAVSSSA